MSVKNKTKPNSQLPGILDKMLKDRNNLTSVHMAMRASNRRIGEMPMDNNSYAARTSAGVLASVQRIKTGEGNFKDWVQVVYRLYAGVIADEHYFKETEAVVDVLNKAIETMQMVMLRTQCMGAAGFGFLVHEYTAIINGLYLIDCLVKEMYPNELVQAYNDAGVWMEEFVAENSKASQLFEDRQQVLKELADEFSEVQHV